MESELNEHDTTWQEAAKAAQNHVHWRTVVKRLLLMAYMFLWNDRPK
jgi:hypothetical protein